MIRAGAPFAILALTTLIWASAPSSSAQTPDADAADRAEEEALRASEEAAAARIVARRLAEQRAALSRRLAELGPSIVARETALEEARERLAHLNERMDAATARLRATSTELERLLRAVQRAAREPTPSILAHPDRAVAAARSALLLRDVSRRLAAAAARARADLDAVAAASAEVRGVEEAARTELAALRAEEAEVRSLLARKRRDQAQAVGVARAAIDQARRLRRRATTLSELALEIERSPAPREPAAPAAPRAPAAPSDDGGAGRIAGAAPDADPPDALRGDPRSPEAPTGAAPPAPDAAPDIAAAPDAPPAPEPERDPESGAPESAPPAPPSASVFRLPESEAPTTEPGADAPKVAFASAKGRVLRPAAGKLARAAAGGAGVDLLTRPYARVIAPWSGLVRFAGRFPRYGEIVIIEPEPGWQIVLTGLGSVDRDVGERVLAGEPIGRMGGPPRSSPEFLFEMSQETRAARERLYFEIRRRGRPIASAPWLTTGRREGSSL